MQQFGKFCLENANSWHFDVEISLAKGIIFRKIGLANGAILKQWAAHPCPKFSREPPCGFCPMSRDTEPSPGYFEGLDLNFFELESPLFMGGGFLGSSVVRVPGDVPPTHMGILFPTSYLVIIVICVSMRAFYKMGKKMCKMMHKIGVMRKMMGGVMGKMIHKIGVMRKMMCKIVFMRKMMPKMKILSSKGEYSRLGQHKAFKCHHLLA